MANNTYGTVRPALINPSTDVDIFYHYRPTRNSEDTEFTNFKKLDNPATMLSNSQVDSTAAPTPDTRLTGMYDLTLPTSIFGQRGFYTVYIKPKEIFLTIKDIGVLAAYPDVTGLVIDMNSITEDKNIFANDNLVGYRIEYFEAGNNGVERQEYYRIVTSNNFAEPISQNLTSANTNSNGYRFNDSGTLCFITVTPSASPSFKSDQKPYIGSPNQQILLTNTKFNPVMIEIEMTAHDIETVSTMLEGNQIRSLDKGLVSTYNSDNELYLQQSFYTVKSNYTSTEMYEVKKSNAGQIVDMPDIDTLLNM